jgi:hypothetical protein
MKRKKGEPLLKNKTPVNSPLTHLIAIEENKGALPCKRVDLLKKIFQSYISF